MKHFKFYLIILITACTLLGCDKVQADQDSAPPDLIVDPAPMVITEIVEDWAEQKPMAYIVHENISKFPELLDKNYPVTFFWVNEQGVYDALGMDFEQIKQHVHDEKLLTFVKAHIIVGKTHEYMSYANPPLFKEDYKNLLGNVIHVESKYTLDAGPRYASPTPANLIYANGIPIFYSCSVIFGRLTEEDPGEDAFLCHIEKALF